MKRKILLSLLVIIGLFVLTGCESKSKRDINYLLDGYVKAYTKADLEAAKDIFPAYYIEFNKDNVNQESLNKELESAQSVYGDDFSITYKVEKEIEFTDEELEKLNKKIKEKYKSEDQTKECYKYEGEIVLKGSKKTDKLTLETIGRCKFDGEWYIIKR